MNSLATSVRQSSRCFSCKLYCEPNECLRGGRVLRSKGVCHIPINSVAVLLESFTGEAHGESLQFR